MDTTSTSGTTIVVNHGTITKATPAVAPMATASTSMVCSISTITARIRPSAPHRRTVGSAHDRRRHDQQLRRRRDHRACSARSRSTTATTATPSGSTTIYNEGTIIGGNGEAIRSPIPSPTPSPTRARSTAASRWAAVTTSSTTTPARPDRDARRRRRQRRTLNLLLGAGQVDGHGRNRRQFREPDVQGGTWTLSTFNFFDTFNLDGGVLDVAALNGAGTGAVNFLDGAQDLILEDDAIQTGDFANVIHGSAPTTRSISAGRDYAASADIGPDADRDPLWTTPARRSSSSIRPGPIFPTVYFHLSDDGNGGGGRNRRRPHRRHCRRAR